MEQAKLAYAIWPWGVESKENMVQAIKDIKEVGYNAYESISSAAELYKDNIVEFKALTEEYGVHPVSFYFHLTGDDKNDINGLEQKMDFLAKIGVHRISLQAAGSNGKHSTDEELAHIVKVIGKIGEITKGYDVVPCIHPHHNTMIMYENEIDYVMNHTDPEYVAFGPDTAHLFVAGCDPYTIFARYIDRIKFMHLKDFRKGTDVGSKGIGKGGVEVYSNFMELGEGNIDFAPVFKLLKDHHYDGYMTVELDITRTTNKDSAAISLNYIQKNF
jgi:inosose dehydratase